MSHKGLVRAKELQIEIERLLAAGKRFLDHLEPQYEPPGAPEIFENLDRYECDPLAVAEFKGELGSGFVRSGEADE